MTFPVLSANGPSGYNLTRSLRFRSSASANLNRTPATATNRTTWTWSGWVKRGTLGVAQIIFQANAASGTTDNDRFLFYFNSSNQLEVDGALNVFRVTNAVFRDPSAWYHIVLIVDTGNATTNNRILLYVNGVSQSFSTNYALSSSQILAVNGVYPHYFSYLSGSSFFLDGYLAEVNFIDGQALTPSSFGSTNSTTGVWQPAKYTGTYGTNGFYLPFTDNSALTTASNVGLGKDFSGNANYWVTNNISITAGATYDSMTDVPTLTSATAANYAVLNPILQNSWWASPSRGTIQDGNLTAVSGVGVEAFANFDFVSNSGKWYYEINCSATDTSNTVLLAAQARATFEVAYYQGGNKQVNGGAPAAYGATWTNGDVIGVSIDVPNNNITFYKNNVSQGVINNAFPTGQPVYCGSYFNSSAGSHFYNFGQRPFSYTPPSGFVALNTYNLPASTIPNGAAYMAATLYTGTGASLTVANTVGSASFQPDLVWIKSRSAATNNKLTDSVRGVTKGLISNTTAAETTDTQGLTAFGSTGFTVGTDTNYNNSAATYVAWQWKAGGTAVSNTNGTITSSVSANTTSGCSVVTYTGNATANATVGHGLGVTPQFFVVKSRSYTAEWLAYHVSTGKDGFMQLQSTDAFASSANYWGTTGPTSSTFQINGGGGVNNSGSTYVAYCFTPIKGFSAFGSYTANGSADGPFVYTGFRPRWVMVKNSTTATYNWFSYDSSRNTYNVTNTILIPNDSGAEQTNTSWSFDFLSNGFKIRGTSGNVNNSSDTYIYAAFAENPFSNALAR